jgi:hypothetical protein
LLGALSYQNIRRIFIMKKLIVFSVIFTLAVASVFALDASVEVFGKAELINGSSEKSTPDGLEADLVTPKYKMGDIKTDFSIPRVRLGASGQTEETPVGIVGGWARFDSASLNDGILNSGFSGFVWWKPADVFKLQIGGNPDGEFGLDGIAGWGFHALANEVLGGLNGHIWGGGYSGIGVKYRDAFFGGWGAPGLLFVITPIEALAINIAIPISGDTAVNVYKQTTVQITYDFEGAGKAGITFVGGKMDDEWVKNSSGGYDSGYNDNPTVFAYFGLTAVENFVLDIGIGYKFFDSYTDSAASVTSTINNPLAVSLGVGYTYDFFNIKARMLGEFIGSSKTEGGGVSTEYKDGYSFLIDILPNFKINDNVTIFLNAGLGVTGGKESADTADPSKKISADTQVAWNVEPYVCVTPGYWNGALFAGIRIESPITKDKKGNQFINWSVPIGITCSF